MTPFKKYCGLHLHRSEDIALVAATYLNGAGGAAVETPDAVLKTTISNAKVLGDSTGDQFALCHVAEERSHRDHKKSDWPAYQASGLKSISTFEREFVRYMVSGTNDYNVVLKIKSQEVGPAVRMTASSHDHRGTALAHRIQELHSFYTLALEAWIERK